MSTRSARTAFRQADVKRALMPALALGLTVSRYVISPEGEIIVYTEEAPDEGSDAALATWVRANARRKA
jgi:hypothetical protein